MAVILIHIGNELPAYLDDCIKQLRIWGNNRIHLFTDKELKQFDNDKKIIQYGKLQFFSPPGSFWDVTCKRLFYLECAMCYLKLKSAWHIENDNLVYCNLYTVANSHDWAGIGITPCTDTESTANFMLVNKIDALSRMTTKILELMELGIDVIKEKYKCAFVGEMRLLQIVSELIPNDFFHFPILNEHGDYSIYDCASWGQLLDGIPGAPGVPGVFDVHTIGHYLLSLPEAERKIDWLIDEQGRKYPTFKGNKIMNLHIHSKRLHLWISK